MWRAGSGGVRRPVPSLAKTGATYGTMGRAAMANSESKIRSFDLAPGDLLAGTYQVEGRLGGGWEGEVYEVVEGRTGIRRAAKLFFPHRNVGDRTARIYAQKIERLRKCPIVIQYHHSETIYHLGFRVSCLISELVEGELLSAFVARQRGRRLPPFEAMHLLYALVSGVEQIHAARDYHGDLHDDNVLVTRRGVFFEVKLVDFFHWGAPSQSHMREDVVDLVHLLYDSVGGQRHYARQPPEIKHVCRGLRRDLIKQRFPSARRLREHLETFAWT